MNIVASDCFISFCSDGAEGFLQLMYLLEESRGFQMMFDSKRKPRTLEYYCRLAEAAGGEKQVRLSDWLKLLVAKRIPWKNAVVLSDVPRPKRAFFSHLAKESKSTLLTGVVWGEPGSLPERNGSGHMPVGPNQPVASHDAIILLARGSANGIINDGPQPKASITFAIMNIGHIGDSIQASGNATLVNRSKVEESFNRLVSQKDEKSAKYLKRLLDEVLKREDKNIHDVFAGFAEETAKGTNRNKSVSKLLWEALKSGMGFLKSSSPISKDLRETIDFWDSLF